MPFSRILALCFWRENLNVVEINKNSLTFETNVPLFMILLLLRRNELGDVEIVRWVMVDGFGYIADAVDELGA